MFTQKNLFIIAIVLTMFSCSNDAPNLVVEAEENNLTNLQFETVTNFETSFLEGISMGMTNSSRENSLYISSRDDYPLQLGSNREQIIKLNLNNGNITEKIYANNDFITKRLFISENKLISVGGQFVNKYELDIVDDPITENHSKVLSKFKIAHENDKTYIVGGDFTGENSDKVFEWNHNTPQDFVQFTTLPENLYGAGSTIVNDKLYVIGGSTNGSSSGATDKIYVIPLRSSGTIAEEFNMGVNISETFVSKYNNNIIVCGQDNNGNSIIGVFDTESEEFRVLEHDLADINTDYKIGQMTILNDSLYIVYGFVRPLSPPGSGLNSEWSVLSASLN